MLRRGRRERVAQQGTTPQLGPAKGLPLASNARGQVRLSPSSRAVAPRRSVWSKRLLTLTFAPLSFAAAAGGLKLTIKTGVGVQRWWRIMAALCVRTDAAPIPHEFPLVSLRPTTVPPALSSAVNVARRRRSYSGRYDIVLSHPCRSSLPRLRQHAERCADPSFVLLAARTHTHTHTHTQPSEDSKPPSKRAK